MGEPVGVARAPLRAFRVGMGWMMPQTPAGFATGNLARSHVAKLDHYRECGGRTRVRIARELAARSCYALRGRSSQGRRSTAGGVPSEGEPFHRDHGALRELQDPGALFGLRRPLAQRLFVFGHRLRDGLRRSSRCQERARSIRPSPGHSMPHPSIQAGWTWASAPSATTMPSGVLESEDFSSSIRVRNGGQPSGSPDRAIGRGRSRTAMARRYAPSSRSSADAIRYRFAARGVVVAEEDDIVPDPERGLEVAPNPPIVGVTPSLVEAPPEPSDEQRHDPHGIDEPLREPVARSRRPEADPAYPARSEQTRFQLESRRPSSSHRSGRATRCPWERCRSDRRGLAVRACRRLGRIDLWASQVDR